MKSSSLAFERLAPTQEGVRPKAFEGEKLEYLKSYIREPQFKVLLNNIVRTQAALNFRSLAVLTRQDEQEQSFFICALALAYTCYLQSRVLIVETREQPTDRSLLFNCILGQHASCAPSSKNEARENLLGESGYIDLLSTESFFEGERDLADFQLGEHIRRCQEDYDLVLVDTACLEQHNENTVHPLIVSRYIDQSILLIGEGERDSLQLQPIVERIQRAEVPLLGIVEGAAASRTPVLNERGRFSGWLRAARNFPQLFEQRRKRRER
ncbi:MAG: hypothetical protein KDD70_04815 [Bdellovibrionales bacterium]|nr:hypothetical protein [Bdellovibrionales bacterium]